MITIIHGDDITTSRKFFMEQKNHNPEAVTLEADKVNLTDLTQIFEGGGLFSESKTLFIEQLLTKRKPRGGKARASKKNPTEIDIIIAYLEKNAIEHTIYLWEGKELEKATLSLFKTTTPRIFKLPQTIFALLDAIKPGNGQALIKLFHQTIETTEAEMIFFMLVRQFRLLIGLSQPNNGEKIDEIKRVQPWQKGKLEAQAKSFSIDELIHLYTKLFQIEKQQKTGTLPASLPVTIDFFLLEI